MSFNMSCVRSKNTKPEVTLRSALHRLGLRYRLHASLPGKPDIVFPRSKIAVFVDGSFWHGRNYRSLEGQLHVRKKFWLAKIGANMARDKRNNRELRGHGYQVVRLWDTDVMRSPERCAEAIQKNHLSRMTDGEKKRGKVDRSFGTKR